MLRTAHKIITGLIIALGSLHVLFTFHDYDSFSLKAMWFAGAGVAIILAGFLNLILLRDVGKDKLVWMLCFLTNLFFAALFAVALSLLNQPQVLLGVALFITATITSFTIRKL
jgi:hypothetical protein